MLGNPTFMCIDAGGENCPCSLAESGNCIVCGRLSGRDCSDCQWHGVCIYNEFIQNGRKTKKNREDFTAEIVTRIKYDEETVMLGLKVGKGFAVKCYAAGSYVFLRRRDCEQFFNVPISVMRADAETEMIFLLVKGISAKTKAIIEDERALLVRGPYRNGIFGLDSLQNMIKTAKREGRKGKILIAAKATGIAPAAKLMQTLENNHGVSLFLDPANMKPQVLEDVLIEEPEDYCELDFTKPGDLLKLKLELAAGGYDCFAVFASDYYVKLLSDMAEEIGFAGKLLISNNHNICCGEGICGACSVAGKNGETMKMCKCRLSGEEMLCRKHSAAE